MLILSLRNRKLSPRLRRSLNQSSKRCAVCRGIRSKRQLPALPTQQFTGLETKSNEVPQLTGQVEIINRRLDAVQASKNVNPAIVKTAVQEELGNSVDQTIDAKVLAVETGLQTLTEIMTQMAELMQTLEDRQRNNAESQADVLNKITTLAEALARVNDSKGLTFIAHVLKRRTVLQQKKPTMRLANIIPEVEPLTDANSAQRSSGSGAAAA